MEACREQFEENNKQKQEVLTAKFSQISTPHVDQIAQQRKERRLKDQEDSDHVRRFNEKSKFLLFGLNVVGVSLSVNSCL